VNRRLLPLLLLLASVPGDAAAARRLPRMSEPVTLVLASPAGAERLVAVDDFRFVWFERIFYNRRAPRDQEPDGRRTEVEDRRHECLCLKLQDFSDIKLRKLRQIEIVHPADGRSAILRVTWRNGRVREIGVTGLAGGATSFAPRFAATVDGRFREFALVPGEGTHGAGDERLARVILVRLQGGPPPRGRTRPPG
jgi:hypothetical protein